MRQKATLTRDVSLAALRGDVDGSVARDYYQGNREARRDVEAGQKIGQDEMIFGKGDDVVGGEDGQQEQQADDEESDRRIEGELTEALEIVRERRAERARKKEEESILVAADRILRERRGG